MKERPILFSASMVRAILAGSKTQTRRVINPEPLRVDGGVPYAQLPPSMMGIADATHGQVYHCRYGVRGDRLWVRETFGCPDAVLDRRERSLVFYKASDYPGIDFGRWRPSIHMPRWASRITLEITCVRVERLQDISEADAMAEGIRRERVIVGVKCYGGPPVEEEAIRFFFDGGNEDGYESASDAYCHLWILINGAESWDENPWVWVIEFKKI